MRWKPPLAEMREPLEVIANAGNVPITPMKLVEPGCDEGSGPSRNHLESAAIGGLCECEDDKVHEVIHGFHAQLSSGSP